MTREEEDEWDANYFAKKMQEMPGGNGEVCGDIEMGSAASQTEIMPNAAEGLQPQRGEALAKNFVNTIALLEGQSAVSSKKPRKTRSDKGKRRGPRKKSAVVEACDENAAE
jgi:hypothetical protein